MDAKALAKSKRAHSQHHSKKHHPNPTLKAPAVGPVGSSNAKKPTGKQVREKPHQSQGSSVLPSNWDRYEEEYDLDSEDPSLYKTQVTDVIVPKSKGADYCHLISVAKSQSQTDISSEGFLSINDVLTDFSQGFGSLLSVRGQGILSWAGDDNFVVEDRGTASHEAPFLSLDLHLLAEQLAKADLSQRLFIEPDLLPPELCTEEEKTCFSQEPDQAQVQAACRNELVKKNSDELVVRGYHDRDKTGDQISEFMPPDSSGFPTTEQEVTDELTHSDWTVDGVVQYREQLYGASAANTDKKSLGFEVAVAEAELDMLLDSFNESTTFLGSSGVGKKHTDMFSVQPEETSSRFEGISSWKHDPAQPSRKTDLFKPALVETTDFDDTLDDLLSERLSAVAFSARPAETSTSQFGGISSAQPPRKGPDLSKSASVAANFDDALDDLLNETSTMTNYKGSSQSHEVTSANVKTVSSSSSSSSASVSKSKVLDDFDSWFDTM